MLGDCTESFRRAATNKSSLYFGAGLCNVTPALFRRSLSTILICFSLFPILLSAAEPVLDTVAKVRALSEEEAALGLPVRIEATVIYYDFNNNCLFVRDDTACTYVAHDLSTKGNYTSLRLEPGTRVRIEGATALGSFYPIINQKRIEVLGKGSLPAPPRISEADLLLPSLDSQWVEAPAVVTGVERDIDTNVLAVEVYGRKLKVEFPRYEFSAERTALLMQRPVLLHGIAATVFNTERQMTGRNFYVPSYDQIIPTDSPATINNSPLRAVNKLLRRSDTEQTLVRIAGIVTQAGINDFYLRDESGSAQVFTAGKDSFTAGDQVEAEGFAVISPYRPTFRARKVSVTGHTEIPKPASLDFHEEKLPCFQAELIQQDADFLARRDGTTNVVLQCRMGDRFFEAVMPPGGTLPKELAPGDRVRLTGICELTTTHPFPRIEWVDGFRLHLPQAGGVVILQHAPWLTLKHALILFAWIFGFVVLAALGTFSWILLLRRQVKTQTGIIVSQREREAVKDERQRIARELHDTVEQELAGLSIQLGSISGDIDETQTEARSSIQLARKMLRHCREEARASIRDLRGIELEQRGLSGALQQLLPAAARGDADFQMRITGEPSPIDPVAENHLLRIAQESVANAARHASARTITVDLAHTPTDVTLTIRDDGRGFDPSINAPDGHFGLQGIRERANKMQAGLDIESTPGEGTMIRVVVPTKS